MRWSEVRKKIWHFLLVVGISPFVIAVGVCFYESSFDSVGALLRLTFGDCLAFYSLMYWWSYLIGIVLIVLALVMIKRDKRKIEECKE